MKKTLLRRSLAWLLVLVMALSAVPFGAFAEDTSQAEAASQAQPEEETDAKAAEEEAAKKAAEEEAAGKAAEEAAAKAAQEAAAKNASAERVKNVQDMIDALPTADAITSDTRSETEAALTAIDSAKAQLTEEELAALDFAKYNAAAAALKGNTEFSINEQYTVTFDSNGGPTAASMTTGTGGKLTSLPDLTMTYYTFGGWYLDRECTGTAVNTDYVYSADATLYAKWTLTADVQAMIDALPDADTVTAENWKDAQKELDKISAVRNELLPADRDALDMTRYNALSKAVNAQEEQEKKRLPTKAELPTCLEIAGDMNAWGNASDKILLEETYPGSQVLTAIVDIGSRNKAEFKIRKINSDWGCSWGSFDGQTLVLDDSTAPEGYVASKNITTPDGMNGKIRVFVDIHNYDATNGTGMTVRLASANLPYTVTFDSNGGSAAMPMVTGEDGKLASLPNPTRTGYTFDGWYLNQECTGTAVDTDHVYTDDTTLYAKWIPITYTVTFDGNGGRLKNSILASQNVPAEYDTQVTPPEFVKDYYSLTAWARDPEGADRVSTPIKNLTTQEGDRITLYAVWTYAPRTVTFDAQGGTVTENDAKLASVTRTTQEAPINTLKATDLPVPDSRDGWYFGGWYTQEDGKGDLVKAGSTEFKTDSTVYAYWIAFEPVTVTLKCQRGSMTVDGKTVTTGTMQTKWPGVLDGTLPTPSRSGYKFQGWYTAAGIKADEDTVFLKDTTLYARWTSAVSRTGNPKTGDQARLGLAIGILAAAAVGLTATIVIRKRKK